MEDAEVTLRPPEMTSKNMGICPEREPRRVQPIRVLARLTASVATIALVVGSVAAQEVTTAEQAVDGLRKIDGFFPIYWDDNEGKVLIEVAEGRGSFLYHTSLAGGLGSNDVGLDRGLRGVTKVVAFKRIGRRVLLFEENLRFRATSDNEMERVAVREAFAPSVVHGFDVVGRTGSRLVIDATKFVVRDGMGIVRQLKDTGQGDFRLDEGRSAVNLDVLKSFPDNTEMEAWVTFSSDSPGSYVKDAAADPYAVTLRIRHSFIRLPDDGYVPRRFDPRSGYFGITYVDYSSPVSEDKEKRFIARHRLEVRDGEVVEPIVFYLDRGVPEPVRSALLDGARWWEEAFEAAGLEGAYRVELLPEDADPHDVRYNTIQWVHRATRGWSWGDAIIDPRTGEIVKGHVALGSLRVRQDYLLAQGLLGSPEVRQQDADPMLEAALARIRQLSAHEVGHTLGLAHNFAASVSDRASVMDYPAPFVRVDASGGFPHENAYGVGIGNWDKYAIRYGYTPFDQETEEADLNAVIGERRAAGLQYISDSDARPQGGAHPEAHLWDNGSDVIEALEGEMALRRAALASFGPDRLAPGVPLATLEEVLVPVYLRHRYQIEAAVKLVGGVWYEYEIVGQPAASIRPVDADVQRRALRSLLAGLKPSELRVPEQVREILPPRPPGYPPNRELFSGETGLTFDPVAPAASLSDFVLRLLLNPERLARLAQQEAEDSERLGPDELFETIQSAVFAQPDDAGNAYDEALRWTTQEAWVEAMIDLSEETQSSVVASTLYRVLTGYSQALQEGSPADEQESHHRRRLASRIDRYLLRGYEEDVKREPPPLPPGSPIGTERR